MTDWGSRPLRSAEFRKREDRGEDWTPDDKLPGRRGRPPRRSLQGWLLRDAGSRCELQELSAGPIVQPDPWLDSGARAVRVELCRDIIFKKLRIFVIRSPAAGSMSRRIDSGCDSLQEPLAFAHAGPLSNYP